MKKKRDSIASNAKNLLKRIKESGSAQETWRSRVISYVSDVNSFVAKGLADGWDNAGKEPKQPDLEHLADAAIDAVRRANASGDIDGLGELWPPAHSPLIPLLESKGQNIPTVCILDDGSLVARIGTQYEYGRTVRIVGDTVREVPDVGIFGRSPDRRYFALARRDGIEVVNGWDGPVVTKCRWPTGLVDVPEGFEVKPFDQAPTPTRLVPFADGRRVLLVSSDGVFVVSEAGARQLLPTKAEMQQFFGWLTEKHPDDALTMDLSMEHGAVSPSGKLIAVGSQDGSHLVFDEKLELVGDIGPMSSYPHYALFSSDESVIAVNSCHFYDGITLGVPTNLLPGLKTEPYEEDERIPILDETARVYAGVCRGDEFIIGDANGYVRAFSTSGEFRWQLFIGSSIGDIDISPDQKTLVVSMYAGFVSLIELDAGSQAPHQIGTSKHQEHRRWLFWKDEPRPLIW